MGKRTYFSGRDGVYFEPNQNRLILFTSEESYMIFNKKSRSISTIKRYTLDYGEKKIKKVAVLKNKDLVFLGELK